MPGDQVPSRALIPLAFVRINHASVVHDYHLLQGHASYKFVIHLPTLGGQPRSTFCLDTEPSLQPPQP